MILVRIPSFPRLVVLDSEDPGVDEGAPEILEAPVRVRRHDEGGTPVGKGAVGRSGDCDVPGRGVVHPGEHPAHEGIGQGIVHRRIYVYEPASHGYTVPTERVAVTDRVLFDWTACAAENVPML